MRHALAALAPLLALVAAACGPSPDLVVYCALDQEHSERLIRRFEQETGLRVEARYDVEANKTVGLVASLREERAAPRCDVFWNNEVAHTVALAEEGLLAAYDSPSAAGIPDAFRDPARRWTGFAARARVLIANTELVEPSELTGMDDLFDPEWAGRCGLARPLTGTTMTHFAALFDVLGEDAAVALCLRIREANGRGEVNLLAGNGHVMRQVRDGAMAWGWTDTDDFNVARETGAPVAMVVPGQRASGGAEPLGVMVIPNTVAVLEDAPHPEAARRFVDWVLSPGVEAELARGRSAQIPVRADVERPEHVLDLGSLRVMDVDFAALGREMPARGRRLAETFLD
jgi:iron(III) transport system substrate-binding protein